MKQVNDIPLPCSKGVEAKCPVDMNELVLSYLVHSGFSQTAEKFYNDSRCTRAKLSSTSEVVNLNDGSDFACMTVRKGISRLLVFMYATRDCKLPSFW